MPFFKTLTGKIIFISLIFSAYISLYVGASFIFTNHVNGEGARINLAGHMRFRSFEMAWLAQKIVIEEDVKRKKELRNELILEISKFEKIIDRVKNGDKDSGIKPMSDHYGDFLLLFNNIIGEWNNELKPALLALIEPSKNILIDEQKKQYKKYDSRVHSYVDDINRFVKAIENHNESEVNRFSLFRTYALAAFVLIVIFVVVYMRKTIVAPLQKLKAAAEAIERVDFNAHVDIKSRDDIGMLGSTFNNMVQSLKLLFDERNKAEKELYESKNQLQAIIDNTPEIIVVKDAEGRYLLVNHSWEKILHASKEYAVRKTDHDFFQKKEADVFHANDQLVLDSRMPAEFEETITQEDGLHTYISIKFPLYNSKAVPYAVCSISTDITERKRIEQRLREYAIQLEERVKERTEEIERFGLKLQKLYEISFDTGINARDFAQSIIGEVSKMLDVDGAAVGKFEGSDWVGYAVADNRELGLKEGMRLPLNEVYCRNVLDTKTPLIINDAAKSEEFKNHPGYAKYGFASYLGVPLFIYDEIIGVVCTFSKGPHNYNKNDFILLQLLSKRLEFEFIKERFENDLRLAMMQADSANKAKSDFLANMSHELRTPLNAIIGFSDLIMEGHGGALTDKQKRYFNNIVAAGEHLMNLINDILDLSKIEAGKMELEVGRVSINSLIEGSLLLFKEKALRHNIIIDVKADDLGNIFADGQKIKQVMLNLLSNAFKYTPDSGSVLVRAKRINNGNLEDYVEISVQDTGSGISEEDQKKLFQPFQQLETGFTKKHSGTGLGLSLCKKFVELHGGRIWVESKAGKGSRFAFAIPIRR